ncbi:MAG: DegT/DnrJ/EryC1/StrS family aminotransferase [Gemmataceae bacterium]
MSAADLPALLGGPPACPDGPPDWPPPDPAIRAALESSFSDGSWGKYSGGNVERLERRLRAWSGRAFALTCASGTLAVEVALRAVGVAPGDEVVLAAYDYPGKKICRSTPSGARPVLVDVRRRLAAGGGSAGGGDRPGDAGGGCVAPARRAGGHAGDHWPPARHGRGVAVVEDAAQCPATRRCRAGRPGRVGRRRRV